MHDAGLIIKRGGIAQILYHIKTSPFKAKSIQIAAMKQSKSGEFLAVFNI